MLFLNIIYLSLIIVVGISVISLFALFRIDKNSD